MFLLPRYGSRDGSLCISVLRSFRSSFERWWRTFCVKTEPWLCRNSSLLDTLSAQHECITVTFHSVSGTSGAFTVPDGPRPREELYRHPLHGHTVICCVQSRSLCFISWNFVHFFLSCWSRCTGGGGGGGGGGGWRCMPLHSYLGLFLHKHTCATTCKLFSLDELLDSKNTHFTKEKKKKCDLIHHNEI